MTNGRMTSAEEMLEGPLLTYPSLGDLADTALLGLERDIWLQEGLGELPGHELADPGERSWSLTSGVDALRAVPLLRPAMHGEREHARLADFCGQHPQEVLERMGRGMLDRLDPEERGTLRDIVRENLLREMR